MSSAPREATISMFSTQGEAPAMENYVIADPKSRTFAIADGFGGPEVGRRASKLACESLCEFMEREGGDQEATLPFVIKTYLSLSANILYNALVHANTEVLNLNEGKTVNRRGGLSLMSAYLEDAKICLANIGVGRARLIRQGQVREISRPQDYQSVIDPTGHDWAPEQWIPLRSIGMQKDIEPEISECQISPGDWLVLTTPGDPPRLIEGMVTLQSAKIAPGEAAQAVDEYLKQNRYKRNYSLLLIIF